MESHKERTQLDINSRNELICAISGGKVLEPKDKEEVGCVDAINAALNHYEGYVSALSTRQLLDESGNLHLCVDEALRRRLETKLITKILTFNVA